MAIPFDFNEKRSFGRRRNI